jgi:hypothetical protein
MQLPVWQILPPWQTFVHEPQCELSLCTSMHPAPQLSCPGVGQSVHLLDTQFCVPGHTVVQLPQWFLSAFRSAHARVPPLPQFVKPVTHLHVPLLHVELLEHALPHLPQLSPSVCVSTHAVPHGSRPPAHVHTPDEHCWSAPQACPQLPQLPWSVSLSTHCPLQSTLPGGHSQLPLLQIASVGQMVVHVPQWLVSRSLSTHSPLQSL